MEKHEATDNEYKVLNETIIPTAEGIRKFVGVMREHLEAHAG
jgi:hypothetical protein